MNPSSLRIRAISTLILEEGISTRWWPAIRALRMRVSMSAIGSVMAIVCLEPPSCALPARLHDAGDGSLQRELPEADPAELELPVEAARPATPAAPVPEAHPELELLELLRLFRGGGHSLLLFQAFRKGMPSAASSSRD